jgi:hypothetical protein
MGLRTLSVMMQRLGAALKNQPLNESAAAVEMATTANLRSVLVYKAAPKD